MILSKIIAAIVPAAAPIAVVTNTSETAPGSAERTEPPLKPNHPNHRRNAPIVASAGFDDFKVFCQMFKMFWIFKSLYFFEISNAF